MSDFSKKDGSFMYAKVTKESYWTVEIMDIEITPAGADSSSKPKKTNICKDEPNGRCTAIVDTGTYLIYGPKDQVKEHLAGIVVNKCSDLESLPKITFVMYAGEDNEPARLTLEPKDYTLEFKVSTQVDENNQPAVDCNVEENRENNDLCQSDCVIGIGPDEDTGWTLGQVFLRSFYSVFDRDKNRVGFVRAKPRVV